MINGINTLPQLPQKWVWTRLIDVCQYLPTGVLAFEGKAEYYSTGSIGKNYHVPEGTYSFSERPARANRVAKEEDVLQARMKDTNKAILIGRGLSDKLFSTGFFQIRPYNCCVGMSPYLYYYVQSPYFLSQRDALATGSTQVALTDNASRSLYFPLAPLVEQHRIVTKIEELFPRLDAGVDALNNIKLQLKRYRQSVLKFAFEGKLTADWRETNKGKLESTLVLLERLREERNASATVKYKKLLPLDISALPELPDGWCYTRIHPLLSIARAGIKTGPFGSLLKKYEHKRQGVPVLGIENIGVMRFIPTSKIHITEEKAGQLSSYDAQAGDILISRSGTVGEVCVIPPDIGEVRISTNVMRVSLAPGSMLPQFFGMLFVGSPFILNQVTELCKGSTRSFLNRDILLSIIFPLPPIAEQHRIMAAIESHLSVAEEIEKTVEQSLVQSGKLRQSILVRAFEGELVTQDPNDEPAEKLLERIKAEKAQQQASVMATSRSNKRNPSQGRLV